MQLLHWKRDEHYKDNDRKHSHFPNMVDLLHKTFVKPDQNFQLDWGYQEFILAV
jgi:hypothetical protein